MDRFKELVWVEKEGELQGLSRKQRQQIKKVVESKGYSGKERAVLRAWAFDQLEDEDELTPEHLGWLRDVVKILYPLPDNGQKSQSRAYFSPGDECLHTIQSLIRGARRTLDICVFTITDDRISDEIISAHRRGVTVRVLTDDDKSFDRGSDIMELERAGIPVRMDAAADHMHHKFAVFDERLVLTGSYNWTRSAASRNQENLIVSDDLELVDDFIDEFDKLWDEFS